MQKKNYQEEILNLIHSGMPQAELAEKLSDYHENDLADALTALTPDERQNLYPVLGIERVAEIFSYLDDAEPYLKELPSEKAAKVVSNMDSDDAVDALDDLEEEDRPRSSASWIATPLRTSGCCSPTARMRSAAA